MASQPHLTLQVPEPSVRPGGRPDFSYVGVVPAGEAQAAADRCRPGGNPRPRLFPHSRARRQRRRGRAVGRSADPATVARRPARHDADALLRRAHAVVATPGQDFVLHAVPRRRSDRLRAKKGARARRHVLSHLSPARAAHRRGLAARRHDVLGVLQRKGPPQGAPARLPLFGQGRRILQPLRQPRHPISPGRRLGDGVGDFRRHAHRLGLDRRRLHRRERLPRRAGVRQRLPAAGHPQHRQQPVGDLVLSRHRRRRERQVCRARPWLRHSLAARRRQRLSCRLRGFSLGGRAGAQKSWTDVD